MISARRLALDALFAIERGAQADAILRRSTHGLDSREASLTTELVFGVLRRRLQLDWLIESAARRPVASIGPEHVLNALRLGAYQLRYLSKIPIHAAVNESVDLVKFMKKTSAAGFVNAVMRKIPPLPRKWYNLSLELSLPAWLVERWTAVYGEEQTRQIGSAFLRRPDTFVRVPPGAFAPPELQPAGTPGAFLAPGGETFGFRRQDAGAQALIPLLDLQAGHRFLDLCAAPGNKTAQALESSVVAVAADSSFPRLKAFLVPGCPRVQLDAAQPLPFKPVFDRILVDAPCSGTGTLGRNPEIRWRLQPEEIHRHAARQAAILRQAIGCLKPGGRLVYSTCSLEQEENQGVVSEVCPTRVQAVSARLPGTHPGDGFWAAVIL